MINSECYADISVYSSVCDLKNRNTILYIELCGY